MEPPITPVAAPLRGCLLAVIGMAAVLVVLPETPLAQSPTPPAPLGGIGRLSGDDVSVTGALSYDVEGGRSTAMLASGSAITVRSGQARIELSEGGDIAVCGPAHFSVVKAGSAVTVALDYGKVHPMIDAAIQLTVYTPQVVATPIAVSQGRRDLTIGLTREGAMCAMPTQGALRIEQQLSGQSLLVPEGGAMSLEGEHLSTPPAADGHCTCELLVTRSTAPKQLELSVPASPSDKPPQPSTPPPVPTEEPVYKVYMPALTFDASAPAPPPDPEPEEIVLVRESRPQPEVVFRGKVEPSPGPDLVENNAEPPKEKRPNIFVRFLNLFRRNKRNTTAGLLVEASKTQTARRAALSGTHTGP
jgi:hypothetical protein